MLQRALDTSAAIPAPIWVAHAQTNLAAVLLRRDAPGDSERAEEHLDSAHARAVELGSRRGARDAKRAVAMPDRTRSSNT